MSYTHLTEVERYLIDHMEKANLSLREIGRRLGRDAGTISRELERNRTHESMAYTSFIARDLAADRRRASKSAVKMKRPELAGYVKQGLIQGWSPDEISGKLRLDHRRDKSMRISHEAIYQWVYREAASWWKELRRQHRRRKRRMRGIPGKRGQIIDRVGIEHRPKVVEKRRRIGDWESDTLQGRPGSGGLATHVERKSRYLVLAKLPDRTSLQFMTRSLAALRRVAPRSRCKTLTADNGKEFALFKELERGLGFKVYFADPYAAWQRGTNENTNGLLRQYFPKGTDFATVTARQVAAAQDALNNRPRKCLGYKTPAEVFRPPRGVALQN
jgi:IS30 family transposase